mmetsp:Transcript_62353/g.158535  ORF Transcript_62353/g.158535 Transcript_62353/m.158535 type:complete len:217 (-) Transcript_62353:136-786(-)
MTTSTCILCHLQADGAAHVLQRRGSIGTGGGTNVQTSGISKQLFLGFCTDARKLSCHQSRTHIAESRVARAVSLVVFAHPTLMGTPNRHDSTIIDCLLCSHQKGLFVVVSSLTKPSLLVQPIRRCLLPLQVYFAFHVVIFWASKPRLQTAVAGPTDLPLSSAVACLLRFRCCYFLGGQAKATQPSHAHTRRRRADTHLTGPTDRPLAPAVFRRLLS